MCRESNEERRVVRGHHARERWYNEQKDREVALWQAARSRVPLEMVREVQKLQAKRKRTGFSPAEQQRLDDHLHHYDLVMLIRASTAALLKQQGHDVDVLLTEE